MDANTTDVTRKALIVRPGVRLDDATRYLVAIRNLVDTAGHARSSPGSPSARCATASTDGRARRSRAAQPCAAAIAARRRRHATTCFTAPGRRTASTRDDLLLAWDFSTASSDALTDWIVAVRDQAFALGTPAFTVTSVDDGPGGVGRNAQHLPARRRARSRRRSS